MFSSFFRLLREQGQRRRVQRRGEKEGSVCEGEPLLQKEHDAERS